MKAGTHMGAGSSRGARTPVRVSPARRAELHGDGFLKEIGLSNMVGASEGVRTTKKAGTLTTVGTATDEDIL